MLLYEVFEGPPREKQPPLKVMKELRPAGLALGIVMLGASILWFSFRSPLVGTWMGNGLEYVFASTGKVYVYKSHDVLLKQGVWSEKTDHRLQVIFSETDRWNSALTIEGTLLFLTDRKHLRSGRKMTDLMLVKDIAQ